MHTLLTLLLIFMVGFIGTIQASEKPNLRVYTELKAISLEDEFLNNNWEVVIPDYIQQNNIYRKLYGNELGQFCVIIINAKTKSISLRLGNKFEMNIVDLEIIPRNDILYFSSDGLGGIMEVKKVNGKLICVVMNNDVKTGDEFVMKVYKGKVK